MVMFCLFLLPLTAAGAEKRPDLVGKEAPGFTLPSTQDRLINYVDEYYGKHHLIITFFPAAFTPV
jgi:peroxiredoxin